jgi:hypothetical protein
MHQVNRIGSGGVGKVANEHESKIICVLGYKKLPRHPTHPINTPSKNTPLGHIALVRHAQAPYGVAISRHSL